MRRRGFTWVEALVVLAIIGTGAAIVLPAFSRTHCSAQRETCLSQMRQIGQAARLYSDDYDGRFPQIQGGAAFSTSPPYTRPYGWADALQPYHRDIIIYQCPGQQTPKKVLNPAAAGFTDYWMNRGIYGLERSALVAPAATMLFGEGNDGTDRTDARYHLSELPPSWMRDGKSPSYRHDGGAYYVLGDSHVKWLTPERISNTSPQADNFTFAVQ